MLLGRGLFPAIPCSVPRARTCGMVEIEEDSSSDEDEKTVRIPRYGDDDYVEDPVIKAQQDRSFAERDRIKRDFEEKLFVPERAADARKYANELFQQEKFEEAADAYLRVLKLLPAGSDNVAERATVFNNLAAVRIRQWRWRDALEMCAEVHKRDPENAKASYRKAQAYRGLKEFRNALTVIDEACEARKKVGLRPDFELDKLRGFVEKDLKKVEDIEREKKEAELRAARRAENTKEKREERAAAERAKAEERRAAAKAAAAAAPSLDELAAAAIAGGPESTTTAGSTDAPVDAPAQGTSKARSPAESHDLSGWFRRELPKHLQRERGRMMIMEEDGWVDVTELPASQLELDAAIVTSAKDGSHSLYYDLSYTAICRVAQFRHVEGCFQFEVLCKVANVDNTTESTPEDWTVDVKLLNPGLRGVSRVERMMREYVYPRYVPHVREEVKGALLRLRDRAVALLAKQAIAPVDVQ